MLRRGRRLRVGLLVDITKVTKGGHGRVWASVLRGLSKRVKLDIRERDRSASGRRPDVWLADGHHVLPDIGSEPLVVQVHEAMPRDPQLVAMLGPAFMAMFEQNVSAAVAAASVVITGAQTARQELAGVYGVPATRIEVVPHGVDLELFRPGLTGGAAITAQAGTPPDTPYIVFVGSVHPRKNLAAVRDAVAALARDGFPHALVVVGGPVGDRADSEDLERAASAELPGAPGRLASLRALTDADLARVLAGADVFCLPSLYEGFGLPCLEAMACGAPVVVSDRGALPELVGDAGVVVAPDADAVRAGLERVLSDPALAADLRARARARAEEFPWTRTIDGWVAALERATAGGPDSS